MSLISSTKGMTESTRNLTEFHDLLGCYPLFRSQVLYLGVEIAQLYVDEANRPFWTEDTFRLVDSVGDILQEAQRSGNDLMRD